MKVGKKTSPGKRKIDEVEMSRWNLYRRREGVWNRRCGFDVGKYGVNGPMWPTRAEKRQSHPFTGENRDRIGTWRGISPDALTIRSHYGVGA